MLKWLAISEPLISSVCAKSSTILNRVGSARAAKIFALFSVSSFARMGADIIGWLDSLV